MSDFRNYVSFQGERETQSLIQAGWQDMLVALTLETSAFHCMPLSLKLTVKIKRKDQLHLYVPNHAFTKKSLNTRNGLQG